MRLNLKNLLYPGLFVTGKILYDDLQEKHVIQIGEEFFRKHFGNDFVVKASYVPTFPLPENAEYAGQMSCAEQPKRRRLFVAHMTNGVTKQLIDAHRNYLCKYKIDPEVDLVYCPSATHLDYAKKKYPECVSLGVQNIYPKDEGNYTGEVSVPMAKDLGVTYVLIGSSHRRMFLGETEKFVVAKVKHVLGSEMKCIIFLSNTTGGTEECTTEGSVKRQLDAVLPAITIEDWDNVAFACEPPMAPGSTHHSPEAVEAAQKMCKMVRGKVADKVGDEIAQRLRVLYSGDICHGSAPIYMAQEDIDGAVFSPKYDSECFINIINSGLLVDRRKEKLEAEKEGDKKDDKKGGKKGDKKGDKKDDKKDDKKGDKKDDKKGEKKPEKKDEKKAEKKA